MKIRELRHNLWNIGFIEDGIENIIQDKKTNIHWVPQIRNPTKVSERCGPNRQECDFSSLD